MENGLNGFSNPSLAGKTVQVVNFQTGAVAVGSTIIPFDDTIPQNTEGDQYMSLAITPQNTSNILIIQVVFFGSLETLANWITVALFQDSIANALAGMANYAPLNSGAALTFSHKMIANTVSPMTFKVRAGPGNIVMMDFNGVGGVRRLGGVLASSMTITEFAA